MWSCQTKRPTAVCTPVLMRTSKLTTGRVCPQLAAPGAGVGPSPNGHELSTRRLATSCDRAFELGPCVEREQEAGGERVTCAERVDRFERRCGGAGNLAAARGDGTVRPQLDAGDPVAPSKLEGGLLAVEPRERARLLGVRKQHVDRRRRGEEALDPEGFDEARRGGVDRE